MQICAANNSIESSTVASLFSEPTECANGICSIDSGFAAMLRHSKAKLTVAPTEQAKDFDFNSPNLI